MPKNALCRKEFTNKDLGLQVRTITNEDGSISINAEDTAIGFGWTQTKNGKIYPKWERVNGYLEELGFSPQVGKDDYIPESLFYRLGMKANNKVANAFQNWLAMEVIPSIRKHGAYMTDDTIEKALTEPDFLIRLATKLKEEKEARLKAEQYAEVLQTFNKNYCKKLIFTRNSKVYYNSTSEIFEVIKTISKGIVLFFLSFWAIKKALLFRALCGLEFKQAFNLL